MKTGGLRRQVPKRSVRAKPVTRIQKTEDRDRCPFWWTTRMKRASRFPTTAAKNMIILVIGLPSLLTMRVLILWHDWFEIMLPKNDGAWVKTVQCGMSKEYPDSRRRTA